MDLVCALRCRGAAAVRRALVTQAALQESFGHTQDRPLDQPDRRVLIETVIQDLIVDLQPSIPDDLAAILPPGGPRRGVQPAARARSDAVVHDPRWPSFVGT
jgi:hypothetical protein